MAAASSASRPRPAAVSPGSSRPRSGPATAPSAGPRCPPRWPAGPGPRPRRPIPALPAASAIDRTYQAVASSLAATTTVAGAARPAQASSAAAATVPAGVSAATRTRASPSWPGHNTLGHHALGHRALGSGLISSHTAGAIPVGPGGDLLGHQGHGRDVAPDLLVGDAAQVDLNLTSAVTATGPVTLAAAALVVITFKSTVRKRPHAPRSQQLRSRPGARSPAHTQPGPRLRESPQAHCFSSSVPFRQHTLLLLRASAPPPPLTPSQPGPSPFSSPSCLAPSSSTCVLGAVAVPTCHAHSAPPYTTCSAAVAAPPPKRPPGHELVRNSIIVSSRIP